MGIAHASMRVRLLVTARDALALVLALAFAATAAFGMLVLVPLHRGWLHAEGHRRVQLRHDEQAVESAAILHFFEGRETCPSVAALIQAGMLDPGNVELRRCTLKCAVEAELPLPNAHSVP